MIFLKGTTFINPSFLVRGEYVLYPQSKAGILTLVDSLGTRHEIRFTEKKGIPKDVEEALHSIGVHE